MTFIWIIEADGMTSNLEYLYKEMSENSQGESGNKAQTQVR